MMEKKETTQGVGAGVLVYFQFFVVLPEPMTTMEDSSASRQQA
jgi:hypothetical protein